MKLCEGRIVVVSGAGRGLGRAHALMLATHGAKVVVNDMGGSADGRSGDGQTPVEEVVATIQGMVGEAVVDTSDVSDRKGAKAMIDKAVDSFGGLDILVNNAGILRDRMMINISEEDWDAVIKDHVKGTFAPAHHAGNYWRQQSEARINKNARIIICGTASVASWDPWPSGPRMERHLLNKSARMQGFLVWDYEHHYEEAVTRLAGWVRDGSLRYREEILEGMSSTPDAIAGLYRGENLGKRLIRL